MAKFQTMKKNYIIGYYIIFLIQSLRLRHLPPFDWKFLLIGTLSAKDLGKNVSAFREGGSTHAQPIPPVIRVVLLHK